MADIFKLAKQFIKMSLYEIEELLEIEYYEARIFHHLVQVFRRVIAFCGCCLQAIAGDSPIRGKFKSLNRPAYEFMFGFRPKTEIFKPFNTHFQYR